jgi:hypothetical protein
MSLEFTIGTYTLRMSTSNPATDSRSRIFSAAGSWLRYLAEATALVTTCPIIPAHPNRELALRFSH